MIIEVRPSTEKDARYIGNNMRATKKAYTKPLKLALLSRKYVDFLQQPYEYMYNYVHTGNEKAVKLLKHLNCTFDSKITKNNNLSFVKFSRCKKH